MSDEIETREVRARFVSHHTEGARVHKEHSRQVFNAWLDAELRKAKAAALREAADALDHCTEADVNNAIGRPSPTYRHSQRYADVHWLHDRAAQLEEDQ